MPLLETAPITNALTVDVEDYFQVQAFAGFVDRRRWDDFQCRVVPNTERILRILDAHQVRGTFFILGWVADRFPRLVREIHSGGHEIGCHSFWHRLIYEMTPEAFREDLRQATDSIANITGQPVVAYRAPCFSITEQSLWALDILIDERYHYDSSIFPVYHDNYGMPHAERFPHVIERSTGTLWEFPPSVYRLWKLNLPIAGGGYFRLYPAGLSLRLLKSINVRHKQPFVFYIHPWELDPDQPRLPARLRSRFRHYQNLGTTERKLGRLLSACSLAPLGDILNGSNGRTIDAAVEGQPATPLRVR